MKEPNKPCRWNVGDLVFSTILQANTRIVRVKWYDGGTTFPSQWDAWVPGHGGKASDFVSPREDKPTHVYERTSECSHKRVS